MSRFDQYKPLSESPPATKSPRYVVEIGDGKRYLVKIKDRFLVVNRKSAATAFRDKTHATSAALTFGLSFDDFSVVELLTPQL